LSRDAQKALLRTDVRETRRRKGGRKMLTFRNIFGVVLFLFGTTFLWLTAAFLGDKHDAATGAIWTVVQVGALLVIVGFAATAWGVFKEASWWQPIAMMSAIVGLLVLIPYWIGASSLGVANLWTNLALHALGSAVVLAVLLVPLAHEWLLGRISG
jgi:hypothetical protein